MIRNANILNDVADVTIRNKCVVSMLPSGSLNADQKVKHDCFLTDLSFRGASILIPGTQDVSSGLFDLVFMSPDNEDEVLMILQAEQRWKDEEVMDGYIRVGVEFLAINPITQQAIVAMTKVFVEIRNIETTNSSLGLASKRTPLRVIV